jgi:hypothetical protein
MEILTLLNRIDSLKLIKKVSDENRFNKEIFGDYSDFLVRFNFDNINEYNELFYICKQCGLTEVQCNIQIKLNIIILEYEF